MEPSFQTATRPPKLITVLGHPRVLTESIGNRRRRHEIRGPEHIVGVGAFEPLFGPHGEGVVALFDPRENDLVAPLVQGLCRTAETAGLLALEFVVLPAQLVLVENLLAGFPGATLHPGRLRLPLGRPHAARSSLGRA